MSVFERYPTLPVAACIVVGVAHCVTAPSALATVVGVLVEVPVMRSVVTIVNSSKAWYERAQATAAVP